MTQLVRQVTLPPNGGGYGEKVALSVTAASTAAYDTQSLLVVVDTASYCRAGTAPTAVATGVDQYLPANTYITLHPWIPGNKLSIVALAGTGNAYVQPV